MNDKLLGIKCSVCGKGFIPAPEHVFKYKFKKVCSWSCVRRAEKEEEENENKT
jgi:uncharacterized OB-fold protein